MYAVHVVLYFGAFFLALFAFIFLAGALIHLVSLIAEALRAMSGPRNVKAEVPQRKPAEQPTIPFKAPQNLRRGQLVTLLASRFQRRNAYLTQPGWLKTAAIVLSLIAVGFVAITSSDETASALHAFAAPAVQGVKATAGNAVTLSDERPSAENHLSPGPSDRISMPASTPRECSPNQGVVTECSYN